jgi:hypothetical protein
MAQLPTLYVVNKRPLTELFVCLFPNSQQLYEVAL